MPSLLTAQSDVVVTQRQTSVFIVKSETNITHLFAAEISDLVEWIARHHKISDDGKTDTGIMNFTIKTFFKWCEPLIGLDPNDNIHVKWNVCGDMSSYDRRMNILEIKVVKINSRRFSQPSSFSDDYPLEYEVDIDGIVTLIRQ